METRNNEFIRISVELDRVGLVWNPEIGDEISLRNEIERVSILVDPQGLTPKELRQRFIWLPTVEQLVEQFEARQAMIYHVGVTNSLEYEAVIRSAQGIVETAATSLRLAFGKALQELIIGCPARSMH